MSGWVRPDFDELCKQLSGAYVACSCGHILETFEQVREHWQLGHFDMVQEEDVG